MISDLENHFMYMLAIWMSSECVLNAEFDSLLSLHSKDNFPLVGVVSRAQSRVGGSPDSVNLS